MQSRFFVYPLSTTEYSVRSAGLVSSLPRYVRWQEVQSRLLAISVSCDLLTKLLLSPGSAAAKNRGFTLEREPTTPGFYIAIRSQSICSSNSLRCRKTECQEESSAARWINTSSLNSILFPRLFLCPCLSAFLLLGQKGSRPMPASAW